MKMFSNGECKVTTVLKSDLLYPRQSIELKIDIDNQKCSKPLERYLGTLARRIEVVNMAKKNKAPFYFHDEEIMRQEITASCDKKSSEERIMVFPLEGEFWQGNDPS